MTNITFYKKNGSLIGLEIIGHTGKADFGKDLLCCQISTVAQLLVVGIDEVKKINNFHEISDGYLKITISEGLAHENDVQLLFETCLHALKSIIADEKKYAKLEVKNVKV